MITRYKTLNSVYEHDVEGRRLRRVSGVNNPTPNTGSDGVWKDVDSVNMCGRHLHVAWTGGGGTVTSPVVRIEDVPA